MRIAAYIDAVAFTAPAVPSWQVLADAIGTGEGPGPDAPVAEPDCLPPRQARRLSPAIRMALAVAEQVGAVLPPDAGWVFASSVGEGETLDVILRALCEDDMMIQPLRFQNAVHNAASGQWSIAAGLRGPMTSIAAYDQTFGAGLLKALMQVALEGRAVGLITYDAPIPVPLDEKRPLGMPMASGLAIAPAAGQRTIAQIVATVERGETSRPSTPIGHHFAATGNPVAAALPLFETLARGASSDVGIGLHGSAPLTLAVIPMEGGG